MVSFPGNTIGAPGALRAKAFEIAKDSPNAFLYLSIRRHFKGQVETLPLPNGAHSTITDRQKPTETRPLVMAGPRDTQIVIDDDDLREAQLPSAILQCILTTAAVAPTAR